MDKPQTKYAIKQKMTLEAHHKRHQPPVYGCSLCRKERTV